MLLAVVTSSGLAVLASVVSIRNEISIFFREFARNGNFLVEFRDEMLFRFFGELSAEFLPRLQIRLAQENCNLYL